MLYSFFRSCSQICLSVFLAGGLGSDGPDLHCCYLSLLRKKCVCFLEAANFIAILKSIWKANLVTFRDFLGSVTIYHSVDVIVFKVITVFPLTALGIHIVKLAEVTFVRFYVVRGYGNFKVHHLVFCMQKILKYFCRRAGILLDYRKIH